ncbi:cryptochrome/photolyase family protein [Paenibacillus sp. 1P07SE]|uniref:cryptochrome/photolyase family protein n=1 Tax=Paenibacillus sp. 1P07SE TaxID=3132209 RepID=UPI0039A64119
MYLFIHRKDLRIRDMRAFDALKKRDMPGIHLLIFDPRLLGDGRMDAHSGRRFLREAARLEAQYRTAGRTLHLLYGAPWEVIDALLEAHPIKGIVAHNDYTPYANSRDERIQEIADRRSVPWVLIDDLPLADPEDFHSYTGRSEPYKVFTPFYNKWRSYMQQYASPQASAELTDLDTVDELTGDGWDSFSLPSELRQQLQEQRDEAEDAWSQLAEFAEGEGLGSYASRRDRYAREDSTSGIARYLNSGALSARAAYAAASDKDEGETWVRQLAWRDFYLYQAIFNEDFFRYESRYDLSALSDHHYQAWEEARTGIPIIDASMTELNETGEMHNRLRMINAMFLTKNLLCPFTLGEQYFRRQLTDYDNCQNRGGWLWSSSLGYDAAPYFRIMNPASQSLKHDPDGAYIRRWLPHLADLDDKAIHRPQPDAIVDLKTSRARAIEVYKEILRS